MSYNVLNYREPGGARHVIGGSLDVVSGGEIDIESGGVLKIAGVDRTAGVVAAAQNAGSVKGDERTALASEAGAGTLAIATGLSSLGSFLVQIFRSSAVATGNAAVSATGGTLTVANGATGGLVLATGDVVNWIAIGAI